MIEPENGQIDVDIVMAKIRQQVAARRQRDGQSKTGNSAALTIYRTYNGQQLERNLEMVKQHAYAGAALPPFAHYRMPLRLCARILGRVVLFLVSFITYTQRQFNLAVIQCCQLICDELKNFNTKLQAQDELIKNLSLQPPNTGAISGEEDDNGRARIAQLEQTVRQLKAELIAQQRQIVIMQAQLGELKAAGAATGTDEQ